MRDRGYLAEEHKLLSDCGQQVFTLDLLYSYPAHASNTDLHKLKN